MLNRKIFDLFKIINQPIALTIVAMLTDSTFSYFAIKILAILHPFFDKLFFISIYLRAD